MATTRTVTYEYAASPAEVAELLQDPIYLRYRSESAGERNIDVQVGPEADGVRVTVSREKTVDVPTFARAIINSSQRATESTLWRGQGDTWHAEYTIEVSGLPIKTKGKSTLSVGPKGCKYVSTFEAIAKIPLIGGKLEAVLADGLVEQLMNNAERNAAALTRDASRGSRSFIEELREGAKQTARS